MLSPDDEQVVRRDPALSGLATVLDPDRLVAALQQHLPDAGFASAHSNYLRYKPQTSCLVRYEVRCDSGRTIRLYAKALRPDDQDKLLKHVTLTVPAGGIPKVLDIGEGVAAFFFPTDAELPSLEVLHNKTLDRPLLKKVLPTHPHLWEAAIDRLAYKPQRRYVGKLTVNGRPQGVLKCYTPDGFEVAERNSRAIKSISALEVPNRIGRSTRHQLLAFSWLEGKSLREVLDDPDASCGRALGIVGAALAQIHAQDGATLGVLTFSDEAMRIRSVAEAFEVICPDLSGRLRRLANQLGELLEEARQAGIDPRPIHGDFYADQVLISGERGLILDLDEATRGDPASDIGNFIAHLHYDALRGRVSADRIKPGVDALLDGYQDAIGKIPDRIELFIAIGLLRLVSDPFRRREHSWSATAKAILDLAESIIGTRVAPAALPRRSLEETAAVEIEDSLNAARDPDMPFLSDALNPRSVEARLQKNLPLLNADRLRLQTIRVLRHKSGRRCILQYDLKTLNEEAVSVIAKTRAKGLDTSTHALHRALWREGFSFNCDDGVSVPLALGTVPPWAMWLQARVPGDPAIKVLEGADAQKYAVRTADALHKLHRANVPIVRIPHGVAEELAILHDRVGSLMPQRPELAPRLHRLVTLCDRVAASIESAPLAGIHRDFYHDQLLVDGDRLFLLDLDLYCPGPPALDAGNFIAHLTEHALRVSGNSELLQEQENAFVDRFLHLTGGTSPASLRAFAALSLARLAHISTQIQTRVRTTDTLLDLALERLNVLA